MEEWSLVMRAGHDIVLMVGAFNPSHGGLESWTCALAQALVRRGHSVRVLATRATVTMPGVRLDIIPMVPEPLEQARLFAASVRPGEIAHDTGVGLGGDVYQPQTGCQRLNIARDAAAQTLRTRLHMMRQGSLRREWRAQAALQRVQLAAGLRVIAVSREVERVFHADFRVPQERLVLIPNGIDTRHFNPTDTKLLRAPTRAALGLAPGALVLLAAAHNFRLKGVHQAIAALAALTSRLGDIHLLVAGSQAPEAFKALAARAGVQARVHFLGHVADMRALFGAADIFVHATAHDACSLATLEAMACGLPVVTTRRNGAADGMADGREGWVLKKPDARALAQRLLGMADPRLRAPMRIAARELAERHDFETNVEQLEQVYAQVAELKAARHA